jgi:cell division GTPase FtsZ
MKQESKEERFKRVAEKRVQNAIKSIRSLSQLANSKVYKWNDQQLQKIWKTLDKELEDCKKSFNEPDADLFTL